MKWCHSIIVSDIYGSSFVKQRPNDTLHVCLRPMKNGQIKFNKSKKTMHISNNLLSMTARCKAVFPALVLAAISAPFSIRTWATALLSEMAIIITECVSECHFKIIVKLPDQSNARRSGVFPALFLNSILAP